MEKGKKVGNESGDGDDEGKGKAKEKGRDDSHTDSDDYNISKEEDTILR